MCDERTERRTNGRTHLKPKSWIVLKSEGLTVGWVASWFSPKSVLRPSEFVFQFWAFFKELVDEIDKVSGEIGPNLISNARSKFVTNTWRELYVVLIKLCTCVWLTWRWGNLNIFWSFMMAYLSFATRICVTICWNRWCYLASYPRVHTR